MVLQTARARKAAGCAVLLLYIGVYALIAAGIGARYAMHWPGPLQILYFAVAGIVWIFPLKPMFGWMNRGR